MRVLLVEDSPKLQTYVGKALRKAGYAVDIAGDGEQGLWLALGTDYDCIVLDIMLPKRDGLSVLEEMRAQGRSSHVLLLTARDAVDDRVAGLQRGADDYLVKPFAMAELLARVQALTRRAHGHKSPDIEVGNLRIATVERKVYRADEPLDLTPRELALLEFLALRRDQVVSRTEIEQHIYDELAEPMSNVVNSAICLLRKKIDTPGKPSLIKTRRGLGYMLHAD